MRLSVRARLRAYVRLPDEAQQRRLPRPQPELPAHRCRRRAARGRVAVTLKTAWSDGTTHLLFEPVELLAKLAVLTPRPRIKLLIYHGVLAPHARWRGEAVARERPDGALDTAPAPAAAPAHPASPGPADPAPAPASSPDSVNIPTARHQAWASLMRRAFALDVLTCPRWGE